MWGFGFMVVKYGRVIFLGIFGAFLGRFWGSGGGWKVKKRGVSKVCGIE